MSSITRATSHYFRRILLIRSKSEALATLKATGLHGSMNTSGQHGGGRGAEVRAAQQEQTRQSRDEFATAEIQIMEPAEKCF